MARISPFTLTRPGCIEETRDFTDPVQPGITLTLTLKASADYGLQMQLADLGAELIRDFIDGRDGGPPAPIPPVDGKPVTINRRLFYAIAAIMAMEVPPSGEAAFDAMAWVGWSATMPNAFEDIALWAEDLLQRARGNLGNAPRVDTAS